MIESVKLNELRKPAEGKIRMFGICCYAEKRVSPLAKNLCDRSIAIYFVHFVYSSLLSICSCFLILLK